MRLFKNLLLATIALALVPAAFAKNKDKDRDKGKDRRESVRDHDHDYDRDHDKHSIAQNRPPGWDKGKKTGWGDCNVPPRQAKKSGCDSGTAHHDHDRDHDRDHKVASNHVTTHHDRDSDRRVAEKREADRRAAEHRAAERREADRHAAAQRHYTHTTTTATNKLVTPKPAASNVTDKDANARPARDRR